MIQPEDENIIRASLYINDNGINTVRKLCDVEGIVYNRRVDEGLEHLQGYDSKSNDAELNILDMNLGHVLRAFSKTLEENKMLKQQVDTMKSSSEYKRGWNTAYNQIRNTLFDLDVPTPEPTE